MKKFCFPLLMSFFISTYALGAEGIELLENFSKNVKNAQGEFDQTVVDKGGKQIDQSSGKFVFSRPGKFLWQYTVPFPQEMICNGKTIWVWDKDLNQVTVRSAKETIPQSPAAILFGDYNIKKYWKVKDIEGGDNLNWIELVPIAGNLNFSKITMGFKGDLPVKMEFVGSLGETSKLTLKNVVTDVSPGSKFFSFEIPKGADVVRLE